MRIQVENAVSYRWKPTGFNWPRLFAHILAFIISRNLITNNYSDFDDIIININIWKHYFRSNKIISGFLKKFFSWILLLPVIIPRWVSRIYCLCVYLMTLFCFYTWGDPRVGFLIFNKFSFVLKIIFETN